MWYLDRFKTAGDNIKTQVGDIFRLAKYAKKKKGYDSTKQDEFKRNAHEELKAFAFIMNSNQTKYGSLIKM